MAEFLIYCKEHWMDSLTQKEIDAQVAKNSHFMDKYDARYQRGDIVEVQPDGFWGKAPKHGWNKKIFALIKAPSVDFKDAKYYMEARYKEVTIEKDVPKLDYLQIPRQDFKYDPEIIEEYTKPTEIPELGIVDIDWVKLSGIIDQMDRRRRYAIVTTLQPGQEIEIPNIAIAEITDKAE